MKVLPSVDLQIHNTHICMLCISDINSHGTPTQRRNGTMPFHQRYNNLPISLKRTCGKVHFPPDGGKELITYLQTHDQSLVGYADASLKGSQASHAWVIGTGFQEDISNLNMTLSGNGSVDGHQMDLSSSRGELQGQTTMAIIT
jgi:hypothetical protein